MADIDNCDGSNYLRRACDAGTGGGGGGGSEFNKSLTNGDGIGILNYDGSVAKSITVDSSVVRNTSDQVIAGGLTVEKLISNTGEFSDELTISGVSVVTGYKKSYDGPSSVPSSTPVSYFNFDSSLGDTAFQKLHGYIPQGTSGGLNIEIGNVPEGGTYSYGWATAFLSSTVVTAYSGWAAKVYYGGWNGRETADVWEAEKTLASDVSTVFTPNPTTKLGWAKQVDFQFEHATTPYFDLVLVSGATIVHVIDEPVGWGTGKAAPLYHSFDLGRGDILAESGNFLEALTIGGVAVSTGSQWSTGASAGDIYYDGGKVGIGNADPQSTFVVGATDGVGYAATFKSTGVYGVNIQTEQAVASTQAALLVRNSPDGDNSNASTLFRVQNNGNVGIGTTNPSSKLEVRDDFENSDALVNLYNEANATGKGLRVRAGNDSQDYVATFVTRAASEALHIGGNAQVGIGTTNPSSKLEIKEDLADLKISSSEQELVHLGNRSTVGAGVHAGYFRMKASGVNAVVLDTSGDSYFNGGNVGIGTTEPEAELQVSGSGLFNDIYVTGVGGSWKKINPYGDQAVSFNTALSSGEFSHTINFPKTFGSTPVVNATVQNSAGGAIIPHMISGVGVSSYSIVFGADLPDSNYSVNTSARASGNTDDGTVTQSFSSSLSAGATSDTIVYPVPFSSTPYVNVTIEGDGGSIVPYYISGVSTTNYDVVFGAPIPANYKIHTFAVR